MREKRFRRGVTYNTNQTYRYYKKKYKQTNVSRKLFGDITREFYELIVPEIVKNNYIFRMPANMGKLFIKSKPYEIKFDEDGNVDKRKLAPNWKKTKELWKKQYPDLTMQEIYNIPNKKLVYHLNDHSDRRIFKWFWDKTNSIVKNQQLYYVDVTRKWDRYLSNYAQNNYVEYYE